MNFRDKLKTDLVEALKAKDELKASTLRMLLAEITNKEIELKKKESGLSDEEIYQVIKSEAKKRKDAAEGFKKGDREQLALKEEKEREILEEYLPEEISDDELKKVVEEGVKEAGAENLADFGKAMKSIMPKLKGGASGDRVSKLVREILSKAE